MKFRREHKKRGVKNVYYWDEHSSIDALIATINGDEVYNAQHSKLLGLAYEWMKHDKDDSKLLSYSEANSMQEWYQNAEALGTEPQPNADMIGFVERSVSYAVILRKKKRLILWSTIVGLLFLMISIVLVFYFNKIGGDALRERDLAEQKERVAEIASQKAMKDKDIAERASAESKEKEDDAIERERIATESEAHALATAKESKKIAAQAKLDADKAKIQAEASELAAKEAEERAKLTTQMADATVKTANKMKKDAEKLRDESFAIRDEALEEVARIEKLSRETRFKEMARVASLNANEFAFSDEDEIAQQYADSAFHFLNDSIESSSQTDILYKVYTELLPKESILSPKYNKRRETQNSKLEDQLDKHPNIKKNSYPLHYEEMVINERSVPVGYGVTEFPLVEVEKLFFEQQMDTTIVTALCFDSLGNRLAIGDQNGRISNFGLENTSYD